MLTKYLILLATVICSVTGAFPRHDTHIKYVQAKQVADRTIYTIIAIVQDPADDPKPCKYGDVECIGKLFEYFVQEKHKGDDNIDLSVIDPLPVKKLTVSRGEDSPVNVNFQVNNGQTEGVKTLKFSKMKGFGKEIAVKHEVIAQAKFLSLSGDCNITGKVLILPIYGSGKCNITMYDPKFTIGWTGVPYEKDGATYMKIEKHYIDLEPKRMTYYFSNLFNDKALRDNMNKFLTENWSEIYPEIRTPLTRGLSAIIRKVVSRIFAKYPYEKFFIDSS